MSAGLILLLAILIVAGCGARSTGTWLPDTESGTVRGTDAHAGSILLRDILIEKPRAGEAYREGGVARMGFSLVNQGGQGDLLLGVDTPIANETQLFADQKPHDDSYRPTAVSQVPVPPAAPAGVTLVPAYVELRDLTTSAREGQTYPVTFRFRNAGSVQTTVAVEIPKGP